MKRYLLFFFLTTIFSSCSTQTIYLNREHPASGNPLTLQKLQNDIDRILDDSLLSPALIGIKIVSLEDSTTIYSRQSNKLFHPASNMKLLTTVTGLHVLGTQYNFITSVQSDKKISAGAFNGNLYVKGCGDPLLKTDHLDSIALFLQHEGVTTINGNLVGDVSMFDTLFWGQGWMWDDEPSSDAAFITPLTVNDNSIDVFVSPGTHVGDKPQVTIEPNTAYIQGIVNDGITSSDTTFPELDASRIRGANTIIISGRIALNSTPQQFTLSVRRPEFYFLQLLKEKLSQRGILVTGELTLDTCRQNMISLMEFRHPLDSVLHQINKPSDNLAAEHLLKTLSSHASGKPGSALHGLHIVKEYLQSIGTDTTKMILADGSGLSWYNAISPDVLVRLLTAQYNDKLTFQHFYESLPIAGKDGTLKNRMKGTRAEGNVHAKTGSLTGVSSLAGYVKTLDAHFFVFSIMCNHFPGDILPLRTAQNKIMEALANYSGEAQK